jgi:hypothetical protein
MSPEFHRILPWSAPVQIVEVVVGGVVVFVAAFGAWRTGTDDFEIQPDVFLGKSPRPFNTSGGLYSFWAYFHR